MAKLDLVLESVRDRYMINVLEEGTTELGALKTKRFLTESTQRIKEILIQEGVMDSVKAGVQNAYLKAKPVMMQNVDPRISKGVMGLGALAGAGAIAGEYGDEIGAAYDNVADKINTGINTYKVAGTFDPNMSTYDKLTTAADAGWHNNHQAAADMKRAIWDKQSNEYLNQVPDNNPKTVDPTLLKAEADARELMNPAVQSANTALNGLVDKNVTQSNETVADLNKQSQVFAQPAPVKVTGLDYDKTHAGGFDNRVPKGYWDKQSNEYLGIK